jgi:hypothetical protein
VGRINIEHVLARGRQTRPKPHTKSHTSVARHACHSYAKLWQLGELGGRYPGSCQRRRMVLLYGVPSVQVFWKGRFGYTVLVDLGVFFLWIAIFCVDGMGFLYLVICIFPLQFVVTSGDP